MRDFYKQTLSRTYEIFGVNQLAKMEDEQVTYLLDALERVSALYNYISPEDQQTIINKRLITDKDYSNINARLIASWFEQDGKVFFKGTSSYVEPEVKAEPLTGEARDKAIENYLQAIAKTENNFIVKPVSNAELLREKFHGNKTEPTKYTPDPDYPIKRERHLEYIKANYDAVTKNALETWLPEDQWLKLNYPEI